MRCTDIEERIDDHADGLLPAEEAEQVRDHIEACASCRDLAFAAKAASASLASWGDLEPPEGSFDRILARIEALPPSALDDRKVARLAPRRSGLLTRLRPHLLPAGAAAAAAIVAVLVAPRVFPGLRSVDPRIDDAAHTIASPGLASDLIDPETGLLPGEVYVHRDPEDARLRTLRLDGREPGASRNGPPAAVPVGHPLPGEFGRPPR